MAQGGLFSIDDSFMETIERKFREKRQLARAKERELFGVFEGGLTEEERLALQFLYAYMPLNDLADYDGELFLSHVRTTLAIRDRMPWGSRIPGQLFLHFVLPYRVNNENFEDSRGLLHDELAERVMSLPMADAILETNHWCHEKATYVGNDPRTVSPLTLIRTALGRCGEQSTLAVAALRSIYIPARQCYTPRWAHCDSNHAWVEAWADGQWHYIGACEPEPRLNQGWFSAPARRAMLVNTRVASNYPGPEDITLAHEWYTEINLLDGYAPHRTITVRVKDEAGVPVRGAKVWFQVYNYAEFTPIAKLETSDRGEASFKTGYGDLLLHATDGTSWGECKIRVSGGETFEIILDRHGLPKGTVDFDMVPPPERPDDPSEAVPAEEREAHNARVQEGALIRKRFEDTFISEAEARKLANAVGLPEDRVWDVLRKARGNSREIASFLEERTSECGEWPLRLLEALNVKDLTDTFRPALNDHLDGALAVRRELEEETFARYVLCPRVLFEMIAPYRRFFQTAFTVEERERFRSDPAELFRLFEERVEVVEDMTYYQGSATPVGTFRLGKGDRPSRDIAFVAACRSLGIPARLHPSERKPQFMADGRWKDASSERTAIRPEPSAETGFVRLLRSAEGAASAEEQTAGAYFHNFSFARLENGLYRTLFYEHGKADVYGEPFELQAGDYRMTSGTRLKDGTVLVRFTYFTVRAGDRLDVPLTFRQQSVDMTLLGRADRSTDFVLPDGGVATLEGLSASKPLALAWIEPDREPSKHLLREITELAGRYEGLGFPVVFAVGDDKRTASFDPTAYTGLPSGTLFVRDPGYTALCRITAAMEPDGGRTLRAGAFPLVLALDPQWGLYYRAEGYKLGTGRELLQVMTRLGELFDE